MTFLGRLHFLILGGALIIITGCQNGQTSSGSLGNSTNGSSGVSSGRTQVIQATASDLNGVSKVEFFVNGSLTCTITTAPYNCSWLVPVGAGIPYQLQTKAYNAQDNMGTSQVVNVTSQ